jgi:hypothetical protein
MEDAAMSGKSVRPPAYLLHRATGQARVRIFGEDHYLGPHDTPESKDRYNDLIHQWRLQSGDDARYTLTIDDLALSYLEYAKQHYLKGLESSNTMILTECPFRRKCSS